MLTLHHLEASRSIRVLWLLETLNTPYEIKHYARDPKTRLGVDAAFSGKGLAAVHPLARSPVLTDGELVISETGAIFQYLLAHYGGVDIAAKTQQAQELSFWLHFSEASFMLHLMPLHYANRAGVLTDDGSSAQEAIIARGLKVDIEYIERTLRANGGSLLGGGIGPADICNIFGLEMFAAMTGARSAAWREKLGLAVGPEIQKWLERCAAEPAYKEAQKKEGDCKEALYVSKLFKQPS